MPANAWDTLARAIPTDTSPITRPSWVTGTTARVEGPSEPVYSSSTRPPARAASVEPAKRPPTRSGLGWVNRTPSVVMTTTKSVPVASRVRSAKAVSAGVAPPTASASRASSEDATVRATFVT